MRKQEIQHVHLAIYSSCTQYLLFSLFFVSQQVLLSVCVCVCIMQECVHECIHTEASTGCTC